MATNELTETHMIAAREFTDSLSNIGFDMDGVFWAYDKEDERQVLLVVTDFFDVKGPLEIYRQIFKAYNASLTPKEIDPSSVRFLSRYHTLVNDIMDSMLSNLMKKDYKKEIFANMLGGPLTAKDMKFISNTFEDYNGPEVTIPPEGVVMVKPRHKIPEYTEIIKNWELFKSKLNNLTAETEQYKEDLPPDLKGG